MGEAARDDRGDREGDRDQQGQPVADRRDAAVEGFRDHDGDAADDGGDGDPGRRERPFRRNSRKASSAAISGTPACISRMLATVVWASATTKEVEAVAKQRATAMPGRPMSRKSFSVPRPPSRTQHEAEQEGGGPEGAPEHDGPAVRRLEEARDGAAEAPDRRPTGRPAGSRAALRCAKQRRCRRGWWRRSWLHCRRFPAQAMRVRRVRKSRRVSQWRRP